MSEFILAGLIVIGTVGLLSLFVIVFYVWETRQKENMTKEIDDMYTTLN